MGLTYTRFADADSLQYGVHQVQLTFYSRLLQSVYFAGFHLGFERGYLSNEGDDQLLGHSNTLKLQSAYSGYRAGLNIYTEMENSAKRQVKIAFGFNIKELTFTKLSTRTTSSNFNNQWTYSYITTPFKVKSFSPFLTLTTRFGWNKIFSYRLSLELEFNRMQTADGYTYSSNRYNPNFGYSMELERVKIHGANIFMAHAFGIYLDTKKLFNRKHGGLK